MTLENVYSPTELRLRQRIGALEAEVLQLRGTLEVGLSIIEETWDGITDPEEVIDWVLSTRAKLNASADADSPEGVT